MRLRPDWQDELDDYVPGSFVERSPVDRLMEEVARKSKLAAHVELAKERAGEERTARLEGLMSKLDVLHSALSHRVDGRQVAYIRSNSPPRSRSSSMLASPREARDDR
eukprot:TRINITY_DN2646_c0_g1_i1.p1 TRINITY_DN2646_c0_g1~~TRINITY_DN2646_c0_g1_i1.p1  ORF type:complete len:108 (+),score=24.07 TRINITY_DN2646_c0_g1_i1:174-497(+)